MWEKSKRFLAENISGRLLRNNLITPFMVSQNIYVIPLNDQL